MPVVVVYVGHQRDDAPVSAVRSNLVQSESGFLAKLGSLRDRGMPKRMTPDVEADPLAQQTHDSKDGPGI